MAEASSSTSSLSVVGLKNTEGERVLNAIQKLADKVHKLEKERRMSKMKVESLESQEITGKQAADIFQRLAKAEARCKALQQQLFHIRKIVRGSLSTNTEDLHFSNLSMNSLVSSQPSNISTSFDSLPPVPYVINPPSNKMDKPDIRYRISPLGSQPDLTKKQDMPTSFSSNLLDQPLQNYLERLHDLNVKLNSDPNMGLTKGRQEVEARNLSSANTNLSDVSSILLDEPRMPPEHRHRERRRRPSSRQRSSAGTPLGQFLGSTRNTDDVVSHYHVKMKEIPFCSAASTGKTHSLGANLQNLMSMVKVCHPALCNATAMHRRRSRSAERHHGYHPAGHKQSVRRNMSRWSSASTLDGTACRNIQKRSRSLDGSAGRRSIPNAHADLDYIPVKLKPEKEKRPTSALSNSCETPGNVCIKTEIKPMPAGSNKVVEVKMTTSSKPVCERSYLGGSVAKRRQLLKNVQELQYMVENDQCC